MQFESVASSVLLAAVLAVGCKSNPGAAASIPSGSSVPMVSVRGAASGSLPAPVLRGTVTETMDVTSYTYLLVRTETETAWAAVPKTTVAVGDTVTIDKPMPVRKFHSPTLNRDFDLIYFGVLKGQQPLDRSSLSPHGSSVPALPIPKSIRVEKANTADAYTVKEIERDGAKLAGKHVTVQAMVVKVNVGILDRNWIHVQDGTGAADAKTQDLLVTSQDVPRVGSTVLITGKVATDKDFGSGYSYKVLVEGAKITASEAK
jgi:hypothetical protein